MRVGQNYDGGVNKVPRWSRTFLPDPPGYCLGDACCKSWLLSPSPCVATSIAIAIEGWPITMYQQSTKSRAGRELAGRELSCPTPPAAATAATAIAAPATAATVTSHSCNSNRSNGNCNINIHSCNRRRWSSCLRIYRIATATATEPPAPPALVQLPPYI